MTWNSSAKAAGLLASLGLFGLLADTAHAEEAPQYQIERCCEICPQALQDSAYSGDMGDFSKLVQGREDWLFRSKIDLMTDIGTTAKGYQHLQRLRDALKERGVELVMVYLPPRGLVNPELLSAQTRSSYDAELSRKNYLATIERLRSLGIRVPDMAQLLDQPTAVRETLFFKRDHHWTPYGAELTAQLLATELSKSEVFKEIPRKNFVTKADGLHGEPGTLNQALGKICGYGYANQFFTRYMTEPKDESSALFGEAAAPDVVLVGTSFSSAQYNFAGFIKQYAGVDVDNRSVTGGGFHSAMLQYLGSQDFKSDPPKILIWEITSYYDLAMSIFYRQIMPMLANGCQASPAALRQKVALHPGVNQILVNTAVKPIRSADYVADIQFSDSSVRQLRSSFLYMSGSRDNLNISRAPEVEPDGRFVFSLRDDPEWSGQTLLSLEIEMPADIPAGMQVEASVCPRRDAAGAALQARED